MLRLKNLSLGYSTRILYSGVTLLANPDEKIGLVGENGSGKTTLFAALTGALAPETGEIEVPDINDIAYVEQTIQALETPALDYVLSGHKPLMKAKAERQKALALNNEMAIAEAESNLADLNEGALTARAQTLMAGLGFQKDDNVKEIKTFSGGWRNRLALARALMAPASLLLLDEPTNHLDIDSLIWLENWLHRIEATVIIISHDREFLDRATQTTWSIENGTIVRYAGNYSSFETQRFEKIKLQEANFKAYEKKANHLKAYIERFRYKATKARQAQSRIKMLEKLEVIEPVRSSHTWRFEFFEPVKTPEHLVDMEKVTLAYEENHPILTDITLSIRAGERIGVLGVNGAGKSTLIKAIAGTLAQQSGTVYRGEGHQIGYFAQHQLEQLDGTLTPLETMQHKTPLTREQDLRDYLGKFKFSGDLVHTKVATLSGGEKARLVLALLAWDKPNLLVLDEPTNHLDMATREALTMALTTFEGALLLVSHDRHLLKNTAEHLILVHEGKVTEYEGNLDEYANLILETKNGEKEKARSTTTEETAQNRRELRRQEAQNRARIAALKKPLLAELKTLEAEIEAMQKEIAEKDAKLADADWYQNAPQEEVSQTLKERGEVAARLERYEEKWLTLTEKIEAIT